MTRIRALHFERDQKASGRFRPRTGASPRACVVERAIRSLSPPQAEHVGDDFAKLIGIEHDIRHGAMRGLQGR